MKAPTSAKRCIFYLLIGITLCTLIWYTLMQQSFAAIKYEESIESFDIPENGNNKVLRLLNSSLPSTNVLLTTTRSSPTTTLSSTTASLITAAPNGISNILINLTNFEYTIPQDTCENSEAVDKRANLQKKTKPVHQLVAVILVHSAPTKWERRQTIRDTWGQKDDRAHVYFVIGAVTSIDLQKSIIQENNDFHDIIQGNFIDTYHNMTYKHVMLLRWFIEHCSRTQYLIKTDDDIFLNTPALYDFLQNSAEKENYLFCHKNEGLEPIRWPNKWFTSFEEFPGEMYPVYCGGFIIVYSADVVHRLYNQVKFTKYFWIDDVYVTGMLRMLLNIPVNHFRKYYRTWEELGATLNGSFTLPRNLTLLFAGINLDEAEIKKLWDVVSEGNNQTGKARLLT